MTLGEVARTRLSTHLGMWAMGCFGRLWLIAIRKQRVQSSAIIELESLSPLSLSFSII